MAGTTVVLSQNRVEFQRAANGYQYWSDTTTDGAFTLSGVRPGTYRLSAYTPGVFGELQVDDVAVGAGTTVTLPKRVWEPASHGATLWQIGTPDRTAAEFRHGDAFRSYGWQLQFAEEFPGGVDYLIGHSTERRDWHYVQYKKVGGVEQPDWTVRFDLDSPPPVAATATLTVALAAAQRASLTVTVNGEALPAWTIPAEDSSSVAYRSAASGLYLLRELVFPAEALRQGANAITFRLGSGSDNVLYDAIRLEIRRGS
jgi:rhamnogalacturonan endolyase